MRYEDWDVLVFPKDSKVPLKEFKTKCHVVHDSEFAWTLGSYGLPTMTCFIPSLEAGESFNISLHSWNDPQISHSTKSRYGQHLKHVRFEARILVDGVTVASAPFLPSAPWPQLLNHSFEFTKTGELLPLRFPPFIMEQMKQRYWNPADELGRIKLIVSEGFPRDSLTVPIERVKNIVAFSFQHAPIEVLEMSAIAWPNPAMWKQSQGYSMPIPSQQHKDGPDAHLHSPRRAQATDSSSSTSSLAMTQTTGNFMDSMPNTQAFLQRPTWATNGDASTGTNYMDPWNNPVAESFQGYPTAMSKAVRAARPTPNSDSSMPDFGSGASFNLMTELQHMNYQSLNEDADMTINEPKVPTNTPSNLQGAAEYAEDMVTGPGKSNEHGFAADMYLQALQASQRTRSRLSMAEADDRSSTRTPPTQDFFTRSNSTGNNILPSDLATSLTQSLLNQPLPICVSATASSVTLPAAEVKGRKENRFGTPTAIMEPEHLDMREVSQDGKDFQALESRRLNSPSSSRAFSGGFNYRSTSTAEFGQSLTNAVGTPGGMGPGSDKGSKRTRLSPSSANGVEDCEEPQVGPDSPRMVQIGFGTDGLP